VAIVFANDVTAEGMDRTSLDLPGDQDALIRAVAKANRNTVVVLHTGSAVLMPWKDEVAGIIEAWYPGQQSGTAIARNLFGKVNPSGRLPVSFPASNTQNPDARSPMDTTGQENVVTFDEGLNVGYRYFDARRKSPLFPFGFGLSYTKFKMSNLRVKRNGSAATVRVKVTNTGQRPGAEVAQVYVGFPRSSGEPPRQLKAFRKVWLKPGRSKRVKLELPPDSFKYYSEDADDWVRPDGRFKIQAGSSSRNLPLTGSLKFG